MFFFYTELFVSKGTKEQIPSLPRIKGHPEGSRGAGRAGQKNNAGGLTSPSRLQQCAKKRAILRSKMVLGAMAGGPWQSLLSWAGARAKGCCSS